MDPLGHCGRGSITCINSDGNANRNAPDGTPTPTPPTPGVPGTGNTGNGNGSGSSGGDGRNGDGSPGSGSTHENDSGGYGSSNKEGDDLIPLTPLLPQTPLTPQCAQITCIGLPRDLTPAAREQDRQLLQQFPEYKNKLPDFDFGGDGYGPTLPSDPTSRVVKWGPYQCFSLCGGDFTVVGPGKKNDFRGTVTKRGLNYQQVPDYVGPFEINVINPAEGDEPFVNAVRHGFSQIPDFPGHIPK